MDHIFIQPSHRIVWKKRHLRHVLLVCRINFHFCMQRESLGASVFRKAKNRLLRLIIGESAPPSSRMKVVGLITEGKRGPPLHAPGETGGATEHGHPSKSTWQGERHHSFQKNCSSICFVRIRYSSCLRRVKVRCLNTSGGMSILLNSS